MIILDTCSKCYGHRTVLDSVHLTIKAGSRVAVLGGNGAGKTTLLYLISALTRPTSGSVMLNGHSVADDPEITRRMVGLLAHQPGLYLDLTARENLIFYSRLYGLKHPVRRVDEMLELVGLMQHCERMVREFSRGMMQRLAIAKALLHRPLVLLLDEPLTGLDAGARRILIDLLHQPQLRQTTVLFTTHHIEFAIQEAERLLVLKSKQIIIDQPVHQVAVKELQHLLEVPV